MNELTKAAYLAFWVKMHTQRRVDISAEEILKKCSRPGEIDCLYRIVKEKI